MRNTLSYPVTPPPSRCFAKWVVSGLLGLFAAVVCISPKAAVSKADSSGISSPVKSKKVKNRKTTSRQDKKQSIDPHWHKKQPFAAITHDKKSQIPAKPSSALVKQNMVSYRLADNFPESGKTRVNEHHTKLASSVFTQKASPLPSTYASKNASVFKATESAPFSTDNNGYVMGPARFSLNYEKSQDPTNRVSRFMSGKTTPDITNNHDIVETRQNQPNLQLGMEYATSNGRVNASVNYLKLKDTKGATSGTAGTTGTNNNDSTDLKTIAIGYTYDASNRTSFYGMVARTDYEREAMAGYLRGNGSDEDSVTGIQFGMTHKF